MAFSRLKTTSLKWSLEGRLRDLAVSGAAGSPAETAGLTRFPTQRR
jgi:hypothetical protein